jgi:hypothetical protein
LVPTKKFLRGRSGRCYSIKKPRIGLRIGC